MPRGRTVPIRIVGTMVWVGCFSRYHFGSTAASFAAGLPTVSSRSGVRRRYRQVSSIAASCTDGIATISEDCWKADTWSVNPSNDNRTNILLQKFNSPAPQSYFVLQRAISAGQRRQDERATTSNLESALEECSFLLKEGYHFVIYEDDSSSWGIEATSEPPDETRELRIVRPLKCPSALHLSHQCMDLVVEASEAHTAVDSALLNRLAQQALDRLHVTLGTDIRGRASADTAFAFCVSGVNNVQLYESLAKIAQLELQRIGKRPSFRSKYVLQMVEKMAACGLPPQQLRALYDVAAQCLIDKQEHLDLVDRFSKDQFDLFSERPLLWLWRFSSKLQKAKAPPDWRDEDFQSPLQRFELRRVRQLADPRQDLILDVGCGMGVSLLGLNTMSSHAFESFRVSPEGSLFNNVDWTECNYVGGDLNQATLGYSRGISERWGIDHKVQFTYSSAEDLLSTIHAEYPGRVALIMIQFPTPFRLPSRLDDEGNTQLPSDLTSGFMASESLLLAAARILKKSNGLLLLQSNCEDVAVTIRQLAEQAAGLEAVSVPNPVLAPVDDDGSLPQRTREWILQGGDRAVGNEWSSRPLIPSRGATETEIMCRLNQTPIHRCLLRFKNT